MSKNDFIENYFNQVNTISSLLDKAEIYKMIAQLKNIKINKGRIFFIGVGGSAGNCSHAVNDFRKLCSIEAYAISDNVSELTARTNDEGWLTIFSEWLKVSKITKIRKQVQSSENIIEAIKVAKKNNARILGIVGRNGGYTKRNGDNVILVPNSDPKLVTPLAESFQSVIWHCIVSSPVLQDKKTKW